MRYNIFTSIVAAMFLAALVVTLLVFVESTERNKQANHSEPPCLSYDDYTESHNLFNRECFYWKHELTNETEKSVCIWKEKGRPEK